MKKTVFYLYICLLFCASCQKKDLQLNEVSIDETCLSASDVIIQSNANLLSPESDAYGINSFQIVGDCLCLDIVFGGGCVEHSFVLYANENIDSSSNFPTRKISLHHNNNEDNCSAQLNETVVYNLSPIQLENFGQIYLLIEGITDTLVYKYNRQSISQQQ